jgi:hypothetical protein
MPRLRWFAALAAVAALTCAGIASAATTTPTKITAGTTQFSLAGTTAQALTANHLTFTAIAPATASGSTVTFPVRSGTISKTLRGRLVQSGGLAISNGTRVLRVRHFTFLVRGKNAIVYTLVAHRSKPTCTAAQGNKLGRHCTSNLTFERNVVAYVHDIAVSGNSATGTVYPSKTLVTRLDKLAGSQIASPSTALGTLATTVTTG